MLIRRVPICFLLCASLALLAASGATAAQPPSAPQLSVLGSPPLKISGKQGNDAATSYFSLLNAGTAPAHISVTFQATSSERVSVASVTPTEVPAGTAERIKVTFAGLEDLGEAATGQLVVSGGASPVAQSVEVNPPSPNTSWPAILIGGALAVAVLLMLMVIGSNWGSRSNFSNPAPSPKWSFGSWATTLTGAGALFGTVLAQSTFPTFPSQISKSELVNVNIFFGIVVVIAPFLFEALRKKAPADATAGRTGTNLTLLISCSFTLWAVVGQLGAFALLGWELLGGANMATVAVIAIGMIGLLVLWYFIVTTSEMVVKNWSEPVQKAPEEAAPLPEFDMREIDQLAFRRAAPIMMMTRDRERRRAEITVSVPSAKEQAPTSWPLL